ncbi:ATP-binding cassette domain-containing protein [Lysinibacillus xylanilyticus]|uniref:ATP-binding cassette domain-containing protein n=1 Tax=Lysinibacillus xylanilyticus TaxID=582475 RepID=UPI002B24ADE5|nr:ATP-binding cassette domain-containing protein [Lysinibacillus xylanilyticus]MEB2301554.1 ATP-binding cassette domain-containing protein [Lysinibacillus xylanilyticus]
MITLSDVSKKVKGQYILSNVNLNIEGIYGLIGPNGAGKTTLMKILASLTSMSSGKIEINGENYTKGKYIKRTKNIGYLPQDFMIYPNVEVKDVIDHIALIQGIIEKQERENTVSKVLSLVNLQGFENKKMIELSGGMRKRVGIAQLLISEPSILLLDEPTAGLDIEERIRFRNLLRELSDNRTIIISSHLIEDIEFLSTKIGILKKGKVLFEGKPKELKKIAEGKVREYKIPKEKLSSFSKEKEVTQISDEEDFLKVRVFSDVCEQESQLVFPRLTEGYLSIVREGE